MFAKQNTSVELLISHDRNNVGMLPTLLAAQLSFASWHVSLQHVDKEEFDQLRHPWSYPWAPPI